MSKASPLDRASRLRERTERDPDAVDPGAVFELLRYPDRPVQREAVGALLPLLRAYPAVGTDVVDRLGHLLAANDASVEFRERLLQCLARVATARPEAVTPVQPTVQSFVDPSGSPLNPAATVCLAQIADSSPEALGSEVGTFAALLLGGDPTVRPAAAHILSSLAADRPDLLVEVTPALIDSLDDPEDEVVVKVTSALGRLAVARPTVVADAVDPLARALGHDDDSVRGNAAGALADLSVTATDEVAAHVPTVTDHLEDEVVVRRNATVTLLRLASEGSDLGDTADRGLIELLDDPDRVVRRCACRALGYVGDPLALELLRVTAAEDDDVMVREAAAWAVDRID